MSSHNVVTLVGNLGRDPDIRQTKTGDSWATFSLATSRKVKDEEQTQWHNIVCWDAMLVEKVIQPYVKKGDKILIEGTIEYRKYQGNDGGERHATDIVMHRFGSKLVLLGGAKRSDNRDNSSNNHVNPDSDGGQSDKAFADEGFSDNAPF
jgi:single-strand DNA-binding protein